MSVEQIVSVGGVLGTFITAFLVYKTLIEMKSQRANSYRPELVATKKLFNAQSITEALPVPTKWSEKGKEENEIKSMSSLKIELFNLGFAAAKKINIYWSYDYEAIINEIKDVCYKNSIPIVIDLKDGGPISIDLNGKAQHYFDIKNDLMEYHDYIAPSSSTQSPLLIQFPYSAIMLYSILIYIGVKTESEEKMLTLAEREIELKVDYLDLGDKKHKKSFKCNTSILMLSTRQDNKIMSFSGLIEFK
ncbi:hypothetical protein HQ531_14330 [bacterium]|nr:hypothetical protein [bacterium]